MKRSGAVIVAVMLAGCQNVPAPTFDPFQARNTVPPPSLRPSAAAAPADPYYQGQPLPAPGVPGAGGALPGTAPGAYAPSYTPGVTPPPQYVPPAVTNPGASAPPATGTTNPYAAQPRAAQPPATYAQPAQPAPTYGQPALPNVARPVSTPQPAPYGQPMRGTTPYSTPYSAPGVNTNNGYPAAAPVTIPPDNGGDGASERRPTGGLPLRGVSIPRESLDTGASGRFGAKGTPGAGRSLALRRTKTPLTPDELAALDEEPDEEPVATQVAKVPVEQTRRAFDTLPAVARRGPRLIASDEGPQLIAASDALPEISPWTPKQPTVRAMPVPRKPASRATLAAGTVAAKADLAATVPAPEVVRADLLTSDSEHGDSRTVTHAFEFEPVEEEEPIAPRELPETKSESEAPILAARLTIETLPQNASPAKPAEQPPSGYTEDYSCLRGQLDFSTIDRRWKVRYIPIDGATDRFGGSVQLVDHAELSSFKSGDWVEVRGRLGRTTAADRGYAPPYEVRKIERQ